MEPRLPYEERVKRLAGEIRRLKGIKRSLGMARLASFLAAVIVFFLLLHTHWALGLVAAAGCLALFVACAVSDSRNEQQLQFAIRLRRINEEEICALDGDYSAFSDGQTFYDPAHLYAADLDILGPHSLFQYVNRTCSAPGRALLAQRLLAPASPALVGRRQEAVRELTPEIDWRQHLQAQGRSAPLTEQIVQSTLQWQPARVPPAMQSRYTFYSITLPAVSALFVLLVCISVVPSTLLWIFFMLHLLLQWHLGQKMGNAHASLSRTFPAFETLASNFDWILGRQFSSGYLKNLQKACFHEEVAATAAFTSLKEILQRLDLRLNPLVHVPLNFLFFWDWHQYRQLLRWHERYHARLQTWIDSLAEMEVLSSFANMAFNNPGYCFPRINEEHFSFSAEDMGHPLLPPGKRVCNDLAIAHESELILLTGSNMAGKSTFLRTVGINIVLALSGAPVCAKRFSTSPVMVLSSMRVADNLEENISTFYAELRKLEMILQRVRAHEKVFLLLDEILRGTNSQDRHTGSVALIRELIAEKAVGIIATHDLALTDIVKEYRENIHNYHFDVQVKDDELFFDYRLKKGICTSMNASVLMRKIGLKI